MTDKHKNDIYGDISKRSEDGAAPPIPAATVVLLRDTSDDVEVLMLRKNSKIAFGGMWVFPGGRIDDQDYPSNGDVDEAARNAASRETHEEAGLTTRSADFINFAHWTPPPGAPKRFATWFFATRIHADQAVNIDGGEIKDHQWISPTQALQRHAAGDIDLVPPTWVTLFHLARYRPSGAILEHFRTHPRKVYATHVVTRSDGVRVALWHGDAGYEKWDADIDGERHRLVMSNGGFDFQNSVEKY